MRTRRFVLLVGIPGCRMPAAALALTKAERKEAKAMLSGTLYLRVDAPWSTRGVTVPLPFSPMFKEALFEVTPTEVRPEKEAPGTAILWELGVNDAVRLEDFEIEDDGAVHIDLKPAGGEDKHGILHFVGVSSLADFKARIRPGFLPGAPPGRVP